MSNKNDNFDNIYIFVMLFLVGFFFFVHGPIEYFVLKQIFDA